MFTRRSLLGAGAGLLTLAAGTAQAQPIAGGRPIRIIVPFPPGGAVDITGRLLAERLSPILGQTVVVENRAGAGGIIGADAVAKAIPDGTTVGIIGVTTVCAFPFMTNKLPFDAAKDFAPISSVSNGALLCVVNAEAARKNGWTDFRAVINWCRAHPEEMRMGSSGSGTPSHLNIEAVNSATGAKILHVPYRGGGPAINDLLAGNIDMMFDVMPALMPHVQSGKFKALVVSSNQPLSFLPEIPGYGGFADLGLGGLDVVTWYGLMAPAGTPAPVIAQFNAAMRQVAGQDEFVKRMQPLGADPQASTPEELTARIARDTPVWKRLVDISGATLD